MRIRARSISALLTALFIVALFSSAAFAQEASPSASPGFSKPAQIVNEKGGICAPWHRCAAYMGIGLTGLTFLALLAGYMIQSKGFETLEHKQGSPEGVKTSRE